MRWWHCFLFMALLCSAFASFTAMMGDWLAVLAFSALTVFMGMASDYARGAQEGCK